MSVWPAAAAPPQLRGSEGVLISVSITVAPRDLEDLLETLARLDFPINPQIYHEAGMVYLYEDGRRETEPVTVVEFPAWEGRLPEIRRALAASGFDQCLHTAPMLDELHAGPHADPAPAGAPYRATLLVKHMAA